MDTGCKLESHSDSTSFVWLLQEIHQGERGAPAELEMKFWGV